MSARCHKPASTENAKTHAHLNSVVKTLSVVLEIIELNVHVFRDIKAIPMWFVARTSVWQIQIVRPPKHVETKNVLIHATVRKMLIVRLVTIEVYVSAS